MELYANGRYSERNTTSYGSTDYNSSFSYAADAHASGRWRVSGDKRQGIIVFIANDGSTEQYHYHVHIEEGRVYWREYYFGDTLYGKQ